MADLEAGKNSRRRLRLFDYSRRDEFPPFGMRENGELDPLRYDAHVDAPQEDMKSEPKESLASDYSICVA